jgi:hypothetical protein
MVSMRGMVFLAGSAIVALAINRKQPLTTNIVLAVSSAAFAALGFAAVTGNVLPGGRADITGSTAFDSEQLKRGIAVELEHTTDPAIAEEIAKDHLTEDPKYYDKLLAAGL